MIDAVEAVSLSELVRVVRTMRIHLYTLNKCEAMAIDMTNPRDWPKRVRGSIDL